MKTAVTKNGTPEEVVAPKSRLAKSVTISEPKMEVVALRIRGTAPLVINAFSQKAREMMKQKQMAGTQSKKGTKREPKDFQENFRQAHHRSVEGWCGIAAPAFRNAMIDACRLVGFKMTVAKLALFIEADGLDAVDGTSLVKITKGEPEYREHCVRNESGVADIRSRPMWSPGWECVVRVRYDSEMFVTADVINLLARAGCQVGICEGRPNSPNSFGLGWGLFEVVAGDTEGEV